MRGNWFELKNINNMELIEKELVSINFIVDQFTDEREALYEKITATITEKLKKLSMN